MHQLRALKETGINEVLIIIHEKVLPKTWNEEVGRVSTALGVKV